MTNRDIVFETAAGLPAGEDVALGDPMASDVAALRAEMSVAERDEGKFSNRKGKVRLNRVLTRSARTEDGFTEPKPFYAVLYDKIITSIYDFASRAITIKKVSQKGEVVIQPSEFEKDES